MSPRCFLMAFFLVVAVFFFPVAVQACAVCLAGISSDDPVADAYNWSLLFLMAMPYTVVGSIAGWLFYTHRRAAKRLGRVRKREALLRLAWTHKESGR